MERSENVTVNKVTFQNWFDNLVQSDSRHHRPWSRLVYYVRTVGIVNGLQFWEAEMDLAFQRRRPNFWRQFWQTLRTPHLEGILSRGVQ